MMEAKIICWAVGIALGAGLIATGHTFTGTALIVLLCIWPIAGAIHARRYADPDPEEEEHRRRREEARTRRQEAVARAKEIKLHLLENKATRQAEPKKQKKQKEPAVPLGSESAEDRDEEN